MNKYSLQNFAVVTAWQPSAVKQKMSKASWRARVNCAKAFIAQAVHLGVKVLVVVDNESKRILRSSGAKLCLTQELAMGKTRRLAIKEGLAMLDENQPLAVVWSESEKVGLASELPKIVRPLLTQQAEVVIVGRKSLVSYPKWQQPWEQTANKMCEMILGFKADYFFGPKALGYRAVKLFLDYPGQGFQAPDMWDCVFSPFADCMKLGLKFKAVTVNFRYPEQQRKQEEKDYQMLTKRTQGLDNIISSLLARARYVKLIK